MAPRPVRPTARPARRAERPVARRGAAVLDEGIPVAAAAPRRRRRIVEEEVVPRTVLVEEPVGVVVNQPRVAREAWSPAQIASLALGAMFLLLGAVALVRTSSLGGGLTGAEATVAGFHHTGMLGLVELFVGLCLIAVAAVPGGARPLMATFGAMLVGFGLFVVVAADDLHASLGVHGGHGVLYLLAGTVLLAAAYAAPLFLPATRRSVRRTAVVDEPLL